MRICKLLITSLFVFLTLNSFAWVYPEHRYIALLTIKNLDPVYRQQLDDLWKIARSGHEARLTENVIELNQPLNVMQLDYAAWSAIAGDHSYSSQNMLYNVLQTDWILNVAKIAAQLKVDIENAKDPSQHNNALRNSDIKLLRADNEYVSRAGSNTAHFLLPRTDVNATVDAYLLACIAERADLNALGLYAIFHHSALLKASKYASANLPVAEKAALIRAALADEAFALHFLQDVFAAGHTTGSWGNSSLRKGTHDYYNEKGLEVTTWEGKRSVKMGDAYITEQDAETAAVTCRLSLQHIINTAYGKQAFAGTLGDNALSIQANDFNISKINFMPAGNYDIAALKKIIAQTPVPGLKSGLGEVPRFRAELGKFWGVTTSVNLAGVGGGFSAAQTQSGLLGSLEANVRFGFGIDGIINQASDGLVFIQAGWRKDASATNKLINTTVTVNTNSLTSAIPGRSAYNLRLRLPFWLIPGDLLIAGPILYLTSPQKLQNMAEQAANGGLIPWQAGISIGSGRFQFVLGREIGISLYGLDNTKDVIILPRSSITDLALVEYRSTKLDFPILEYRYQRRFSQDQSSSIMYQVSGGVDIPHGAKLADGVTGTLPQLRNVWYLGLRVLFNYRHYL